MTSRYLTELDAALAEASDPTDRDCHLAEKAAYLARRGSIDEACTILDALHKLNHSSPNLRLSVLVNLADGQLSFVRGLTSEANDRIRRAHALAAAASVSDLQARSAAWLGHIAYGQHQFAQMFQRLVTSFRLAKRDEYQALARAALVSAQAYHLANLRKPSEQWYARVNDYAAALGDDTVRSARHHNRASIQVANIRNAQLGHIKTDEPTGMALINVDSTANYDAMVGAVGQDTFTPLLRAQILVLEEEFDQALDIYNQQIDRSRAQGLGRMEHLFLADTAWCNLRLGRQSEAARDINLALGFDRDHVHIDDAATIYSRASNIFDQLGDSAGATANATLAADAWAKFVAVQQEIAGGMQLVEAAFQENQL